jgi:hypothetical protein
MNRQATRPLDLGERFNFSLAPPRLDARPRVRKGSFTSFVMRRFSRVVALFY